MDPVSPGMPGGMPPPPVSPAGRPPPENTPPMGGSMGGLGDDPHTKIIEVLRRIEDRLSQIAAKLGV